MLVRKNGDGSRDCVAQEQHAQLSGLLAAHWHTRLDPRLVLAITLHDSPWRETDRDAEFDTTNDDVLDFISMPLARRLAFYATGIDDLEAIDPYVAYMTSRHYTAFGGLRGMEEFQASESVRRERLRKMLDARTLATEDEDLRWIQYFDILSLYLCMSGPDVDDDALPRWLVPAERWLEAPDGTNVRLEWTGRDGVEVTSGVFDETELTLELGLRTLERPASASALNDAWRNAESYCRRIELVAR